MCGAVHAQVTDSIPHLIRRYIRDDEMGLLAGFVQGRQSALEVGLSRNIYGVVHHPFALNYFIGTEVELHDKPLIGPKLGVWVSGGMAMGAQAIWYTDGTDNAFVLRPEIGIGIFKAKMTYGYNIRCVGQPLSRMNTHVLNVAYCFRLKRISHVEQ